MAKVETFKKGQEVEYETPDRIVMQGVVSYINGYVVKVKIGDGSETTFSRKTNKGVHDKSFVFLGKAGSSDNGKARAAEVRKQVGRAADAAMNEFEARARAEEEVSSAQEIRDKAKKASRMVYVQWLYDEYLSGTVSTEDTVTQLDEMLEDLGNKIEEKVEQLIEKRVKETLDARAAAEHEDDETELPEPDEDEDHDAIGTDDLDEEEEDDEEEIDLE